MRKVTYHWIPAWVIFLSAGSAVTTTATAAGGLSMDSVNQTSQLLAGIAPRGGTGRQLADSAEWKYHASVISKEWKQYELRTLKPMSGWAGAEIRPRIQSGGVVRYLFSGPDSLHVVTMFPNAGTYILGGLEPVGVAPTLDRFDDRSVSTALVGVRKSLEENIHFSFFKTLDMKVDLKKAAFPGTLPVICLFLARSGYEIDSIDFTRLQKNGSLARLGPGSRRVNAVVVRFSNRRGRHRAVKTLYYFQTDVSNGNIGKSGFLTFLRSQDRGACYLKAASYLMHNSYFSTIRKHLLDFSNLVVEDDSGIPLRYFGGGGWRVACYGHYTRPIDLFSEHFQSDLHRAYRGRGVFPLTFGTGYRWRKSDSNLLVATRQRGAVPRAQIVVAKLNPARKKPTPKRPARVRRVKPIENTAASAAPGHKAGSSARGGGKVELRLKLLRRSVIEDTASAPGGRALGVYEYQVEAVERGAYPHDRIRIAHGIVWNGEFTAMARRQPGWRTSLELAPISTYPSLRRIPLDDDLPPNSSLPLYVPTLD